MALPIILAIDDELDALRDLERDLGKRYSADYQVLAIESPERGLELLTAAQRDRTEVAVVIACQRMKALSGIDFLVRAHELHPLARRVLLIRISDTESIGEGEKALGLSRLATDLT